MPTSTAVRPLMDLPAIAERLGVGHRHIRRLVYDRRVEPLVDSVLENRDGDVDVGLLLLVGAPRGTTPEAGPVPFLEAAEKNFHTRCGPKCTDVCILSSQSWWIVPNRRREIAHQVELLPRTEQPPSDGLEVEPEVLPTVFRLE